MHSAVELHEDKFEFHHLSILLTQRKLVES